MSKTKRGKFWLKFNHSVGRLQMQTMSLWAKDANTLLTVTVRYDSVILIPLLLGGQPLAHQHAQELRVDPFVGAILSHDF